MNRDGLRKSIWQEETEIFEQNELSDTSYDVVIVGGGITGVSCAIRLANAGKKCLLMEAVNIGFGTTGGTTAHLNNFFDAGYDQVIKDFGLEQAKLLANAGKEALSIIRHHIMQHSIACDFQERTGYLFAVDDKQVQDLDAIVEGSIKAGISMQYVEKNPFPIPCQKTVSIPGQAQFHPVKYIRALIHAYLAAGGSLVEDCRALEADEKEDKVVLHTSKGIIEAQQVVYATHIPPGINVLHFTNAPYRSYAIAAKLRNDEYPKAMGYDLYDPYHYYRTQKINDEEYLIAGGEDHKTGHEKDTGECFSRLEEYLRRYFDVDHIAFSWSSQYFIPADGLPYIGKMPHGAKRVYVATGYNGNGMIFGTIAAKVISDLIIKGSSEYEKLFDPSRIKPVAAFANTVKETADVLVHFIKDKLLAEKINSLAELKENEAKVVRYEGNAYAIYKDPQGRAHILNSACTHAQCNVQWNNAEMTWDCPCHGSRFNVNGKVLTAPAVQDLSRPF